MSTKFTRPVLCAGFTAGLVAALCGAPGASASPTVTREINIHHDEGYRHFDPDPSCGPYEPFASGVTEHLVDNEHLVVVDDGTRLNVTFGETFWIEVIPDDPSLPVTTRKGTDAGHFVALRDGDTIFHESFHDYGGAAWNPDAKIRTMYTFVTHDGEVDLKQFVVNDFPPEGC
jgi:hypothetical protein